VPVAAEQPVVEPVSRLALFPEQTIQHRFHDATLRDQNPEPDLD
jgi:hypothetical protein